jgi:multidrug efflux pump subunit AcrB
MAEQTSYLKKIKFDPTLLKGRVASYLGNPRLLILILISVLILGVSSFVTLKRSLNPEVKIPLVIISTVLPGASPDDVESLVTVHLEDEVSSVEGVKTVTSTSRDSVSIITIEFDSNIDPEKARSDVQSAVDAVNDLPEDVQDPDVQKLDFENEPVWTFTVTGGGDVAGLSTFAQRLKDSIENLPNIKNVEIGGQDVQEVQVILKPEAITAYNLNPMALSGLIKSATGSFPAGVVETNTSAFSLTIDPSVTDIEDIRNLRISVGGTPIRLSEIADIAERSKPNQSEAFYANPKEKAEKALTIRVFKTSGADINKAAKDAEAAAEETLHGYENQFSIQTVLNTGEEIDHQFGELLRDFWITIALVFIVLFLIIGLREAIVAALAVPLTFLITFTVMQIMGISLNFLSMFSLLLALGLLVDDTIVVVSAMSAYYRSGKFTPYQTGLLVWRDFLIPIFTTTITTVWAFLPLLLASGIIGEFIKSIPIVVSTTLVASFFVAMFITLPFIILILKPQIPNRVVVFLRVLFVIILLGIFLAIAPKGIWLIPSIMALVIFLAVTATARMALIRNTKGYVKKNERANAFAKRVPALIDTGVISFDKISNAYKRAISRILASQKARRTAITMVVIFSIFSYLLVPFGFIKNEFFPKSDSETLYVALELPAGTKAAITKEKSLELLEELRTTEGLDFASAQIGQGYNASSGISQGENNNALITMALLPQGERNGSSIELAENLRDKYADYQSGKISIIEQSGGPPAGADIQISILGDDLTVLDQYANKVQDYLRKQPGTTNIDKSIKPGTSKLVFEPNQDQLTRTGISQDQVGLWLRFFASGTTADTVKLSGQTTDQDIALRMDKGVESPEAISNISIPTQNGNVPLASLGDVTLKTNPTLITREDSKRQITITAGVTQGYTTSEINSGLEAFAENGLGLPDGYTWKTGGVNEENQESVNSILRAMLISFILIIVTMVLQFQSFRRALIVMLVIPLSISGVFIIFALTQTPLSFPALIGVLALFGIVVKNAILVVDKIIENQKIGLDFNNAIADAAASRLEAIALTSIATIMGLIPVTLSDPLWRGLGGAIIAGLTFSGTIMLFFIPVVYYYWFHPKYGKSRK